MMLTTKIRPWLRRCVVCDEKIGQEEAILINDSVFHLRHFKCCTCQQEISDQFHVLDRDRVSCVSCYVNHFAPRCSSCFKGILDDCVRASDRHFHSKCFKCQDCGVLLTDEFLVDSDGNFLDRDCFWQRRLLKFVAKSRH
ncbi:hypothetical protein M3Y94_01098200 [Aphelenchoides besseyi]|nr:hypothetical protein M3Y94_01098200 [Aphelenchoides besseyi]KAI6221639.1 Thyroid receptor-interacting protein 6 [Aphelenchoides besseyi]